MVVLISKMLKLFLRDGKMVVDLHKKSLEVIYEDK
jgi:hypothetical protein